MRVLARPYYHAGYVLKLQNSFASVLGEEYASQAKLDGAAFKWLAGRAAIRILLDANH